MEKNIEVVPKSYFHQIFTIDCSVCKTKIFLRIEKVTAVRCIDCNTKLKLKTREEDAKT